MMVSNMGFAVGSIVGGIFTVQIYKENMGFEVTNVVKGIISVFSIGLSFYLRNGDTFADSFDSSMDQIQGTG